MFGFVALKFLADGHAFFPQFRHLRLGNVEAKLFASDVEFVGVLPTQVVILIEQPLAGRAACGILHGG